MRGVTTPAEFSPGRENTAAGLEAGYNLFVFWFQQSAFPSETIIMFKCTIWTRAEKY